MNTAAPVLVVDDEPSICWALEKMLTQEGHRVVTASSAEEGLRLAAEHRPVMVILDVRLPKEDGITALPKFLSATGDAPVIIITAFGDLETAVAAVKNGATDYLTKPFKLEDALRTCRQALRKSRTVAAPVQTQPMATDNAALVGGSPAMQQVFRQIALVADSDLSVLITGETGTGKELVAAAIHRHSRRADKPYLPIAPVALNTDLIESELFGHIKGAFTGAVDDRPGLFERAEGGTVLLDEIGDLPIGTQVKLLRVLEQGEYCRVGDIQPRQADVRILAATNSDLHQAVGDGEFREDLFHRLSGVQIHLPPLRERTEDIGVLCHHFLHAMNYPAAETAIDSALLAELVKRPWSGNVRELKNAVGHAAVVARGRSLAIGDFPPPKPGRDPASPSTRASVDHAVREWAGEAIARWEEQGEPLHAQFLTAAEPALLRRVLEHTGGNRAKAAEMLGIHRGTLRDRLRAYGIDD
ncbi:sigma-54-dependent Fis family transcriptional regulator [Roseiconus nitratireducens]|uniref:DNA-binding transcriptional regulator NtrC n=1 Tax=Roseiconus nitratireducens TaxID=2605748 RepID=A0A5M6D9S8_9BACT|nr:sigma-54 dependent transcriptional regulator [Roseiconus nitratireducens]KAA5541945.1 sigma-54-dependent Fis family transcriptional regulator [Roseiconus nitratireducens]